MEKPLERHIEEIMNNPGVTGVLCADSQGLCLAAKGVAKRESSGLISYLAQQAAKLHPEAQQAPVISLEYDIGHVLIKSHDNITMAIFKNP